MIDNKDFKNDDVVQEGGALNDAVFEQYYRSDKAHLSEFEVSKEFDARLLAMLQTEDLRIQTKQNRLKLWGNIAIYSTAIVVFVVGLIFTFRRFGIEFNTNVFDTEIFSAFQEIKFDINVEFGENFGLIATFMIMGLSLLIIQMLISRRLERNNNQ